MHKFFILGFVDAPPAAVMLDPMVAATIDGDAVAGVGVFLVERRGVIAASCSVEVASAAGDRIVQLERMGGLSARARVRDDGGVTVVEALELHGVANRDAATGWRSGTPAQTLPPVPRSWCAHASVAAYNAANGAGFTLAPPPGSRPAGVEGVCELRLDGEIDDAVAREFLAALASAEGRTVRVSIRSPGGDVEAGELIYAALLAHAHRVDTYIEDARSMAAIVALAGDRRTAAPGATVLFHHPEYLQTRGGAPTLRALADELDVIGERFATILQARAGLSRDAATALVAAGRGLSAAEALERGIVHQIFAAGDDDVRRNIAISAGLKGHARPAQYGERFNAGDAVWWHGAKFVARRPTFLAPGSLEPHRNAADWLAARPEAASEIVELLKSRGVPQPLAMPHRRRPPASVASVPARTSVKRRSTSRPSAPTAVASAPTKKPAPRTAETGKKATLHDAVRVLQDCMEAAFDSLENASRKVARLESRVNTMADSFTPGPVRTRNVDLTACVVQTVKLADGSELDVVVAPRDG